ncbi:MAG: VWA domain-containing protein [Acidobacteria bacterium]|nr:VWA domain-containing protein [Acidobacteriota bacterium]
MRVIWLAAFATLWWMSSAPGDRAFAVSNPQSAIRNPQSHLVQLDIIVSDARGRVVSDLTPADFELREEGTPQVIEQLRFVQAAGGGDPRLFSVFLDEYHVSRGENTDRARAAVTQFVEREVGSSDLIVVMKPLDSLLTIQLTHDRDAVRRVLESFEGRRGDYEPRNAYEKNYFAGTPARIESARNQVALSALNALAVHLGALTDRRKTLVLVSEGIGRAERRRGQEFLPSLETVIRSANRANVSVYPVDPEASAADDPGGAALRTLAGETDGLLIDGDLLGGLSRAAADSKAYYLLAYRSMRPDDGKFHAVQVQAKRPGLQLRARKGYWAPSPDDALRAEVLAKINAPKPAAPLEPAPHVSTLIRPWFGMDRGDAGRTRVTFVWEPATRVPGDRSRRVPSRLVLTALAPDGEVLFEGPVSPTGPATVDEPGATAARALFETPPGRLRLRMSIQDAGAQVLDQDVRELAVRDLHAGVVISTPEVLRARTAREFRSIDTVAAVPVASRDFSRTETLLIRFHASGSSSERPALSARLLGRMGQVMRDLPVTPAATPDGENTIDLSLAGLASGEYAIEVTAKSAAGEATDRITFRVTS